MLDDLDLTPPLPMAERIAEALRRAISTGGLAPGSRINESELASAHRISRSPIREALRILQQEGLVAMEPRRGAFVRRLAAAEILEVYGVKAMLEGYATGLATRRLDTIELDRLGALVRRMEAEAAAEDARAYVETTREFHERIVRASANATLCAIYHSLDRKIHALRRMSLAQPGRMAASLVDHRAILAAMRAGDAAGAERLARTHIEAAAAALLPRLAELAR